MRAKALRKDRDAELWRLRDDATQGTTIHRTSLDPGANVGSGRQTVAVLDWAAASGLGTGLLGLRCKLYSATRPPNATVALRSTRPPANNNLRCIGSLQSGGRRDATADPTK